MSAPAVAAWIVSLVGHQFDLEDLPLYLDGCAVHVAQREDGYYLVIPTGLGRSAPEAIRDLAAAQLALINGAVSLIAQSFRPISLGKALYGIDSEGRVTTTVMQIEGAELRVKGGNVVLSVNGVAQPDGCTGAGMPMMRGATASMAAADVLAIVGRAKPTWSELYVVYEIVKANCGGRMFEQGWIQKTDATRFCRTANSYTALGRDARHGQDQGQPPTDSLTQREATTLIRALAAAWLRRVDSIIFEKI